MTFRQALSHLRHEPQDALYYVQGVLRHWCYKRPFFRGLLGWHLIEQFHFRKNRAYPCYEAGECRCCGCETPHLFWASKGCKAGSTELRYRHCAGMKACYPRLMNRTDWYWFVLRQRP